jgi:hypothetical protein
MVQKCRVVQEKRGHSDVRRNLEGIWTLAVGGVNPRRKVMRLS